MLSFDFDLLQSVAISIFTVESVLRSGLEIDRVAEIGNDDEIAKSGISFVVQLVGKLVSLENVYVLDFFQRIVN